MSLRFRIVFWSLLWSGALVFMFWWYWSAPGRTTMRYHESAEHRWNNEDYLGAIHEYEKIIDEYPQSPLVAEAYYWRGVAFYLYLDNAQKAIASLNESIQRSRFPIDQERAIAAHLHLAEIYEKKLDLPKETIAAYEKVMELSADSDQILEIQYKVGELYFDLGDMEQARIEWDLLIKKDPKSPWVPPALYRQGSTYFIAGRCDKATEIYRDLYARYPDHEVSLFAKFRAANCLEERQQHRDALQLYREIGDRYPNKELIHRKIKKLEALGLSS